MMRNFSPYRTHRGNSSAGPWMRPSRFVNPNQSQPLYSDNYSNPRSFHHNRGIGNSRYGMRDSSVHRMAQPYGGGYRNGRYYGRPSHSAIYQQHPPSLSFYNNNPINSVQEYVPYPYSSLNASEFHNVPKGCGQNNPTGNTMHSPIHGAYNGNTGNHVADDADAGADASIIPYCPQNFRMIIAAGDLNKSTIEEPTSSDQGKSRPPSVASSSSSTHKALSRRGSTDSSDGSISSAYLSSESDSDAYSVEDSSSRALEPAEEEKSSGDDSTVHQNNAFDSVGIEEYLGTEETIDFNEFGEGAPTYIFDEQEFIMAYVEARSSTVIDGKGNTSMDEISCYGVWFGKNNKRNVYEEVPSAYTIERRKSGYILGVIKALSIVKSEGDNKRIHLVLGSPFVMENLSGWVKNLKNSSATSTNWTEWKHFNEIIQLLSAIDGMVLKFSLAHPRDSGYKECKRCIFTFHEEMKQTRLQQSSNSA